MGSLISFGQENESVLSAPDNWLSEIIPFPLGFAQQIEFVGFEDLRFSPEWSDSTSQQFWKDFSHEVWKLFDGVKLKVACD